MSQTKGVNKAKKENKRLERLRKLIGIDLCACAGGHQRKCSGICRKQHIDQKTGHVKCVACYRIEKSDLNLGKKRQKRSWDRDEQKNDRPRRKKDRENRRTDYDE